MCGPVFICLTHDVRFIYSSFFKTCDYFCDVSALCRWAYVKKYGQLTDITGQPISRASSGGSAQPFQQRPRAVDRSLTCDSDMSDSSSGSEGEDMIPAGQSQDGSPSGEKIGGTALSRHSAKPQSACKPCHSQ